MENRRVKRKIRRSYFVATVSIAMVLFLLGAVTYLIMSALHITDRLKESVTVHVMLSDGLKETQTAEMKQSIERESVVRTVKYVSKDEAAAQFIAETGDDFRTFLDYNPLPDSFEVGLNASSAEKEAVEAFVGTVQKMAGVSEVVYQKNVVEQMGANLGKLNFALGLFGVAMLIISLVLLSNTVRMTIIAKRHIINTMKLVGAGRGFIVGQFAGPATLNGFWAGVVATLMLAGLAAGLHGGALEMSLTAENRMLLYIAGAMIVAGMAISLVFTAFAVRKAIRQTTNKAYLL